MATTDLNDNGTIEANEKATATTDSDGKYSVQAPVEEGRKTVVAFSKEGYSTAFKTISVNSTNDISEVNGTVTKMETLNRTASGWSDQGNTVQINGIELSSGYAKVFNPATDTDKFPGPFSDNQGNMLESGVFAAFDLKDENGNEINQVTSGTAEIRMKFPRDTWPVIRDLTSGNNQIDVPMYYFDEDQGDWARGATDGWLEDADGNKISESELSNIRNQTYSGIIYAVSEATHFSYWNVDWPVSTHACVTGTVVDATGNPVAGAMVYAQGVTYTGSSTPQVTDENGEFCIDVMRSESPGEDIDNDGTTGETQQILITATFGGKIYRIDPINVTTDQGSCPGGCMNIGNIELTQQNEISISTCVISGTVYQDDGITPAVGAFVYAIDETVDPAIAQAVCDPSSGCMFFDITDSNGEFQVSGAFATKLQLIAFHQTQVGDVMYVYMSQKSYTTCPTNNVDIVLELKSCYRQINSVAELSGMISWSPAEMANSLSVTDISTGTIKWLIVTQNGFNSPVTYGTLPANTQQIIPESGMPVQIQASDLITVSGTFTDSGNTCHWIGTNMLDNSVFPKK
jgi:hypothetical protein